MKARLPILDFLRWTLATYVIFFHFWAWTKNESYWENKHAIVVILQYGYLSVDIFFVLSGFAIFASTDGKNTLDFIEARIKRLVPTFIFVSIIETIFTFFLYEKHLWGNGIISIINVSAQNLLPISGNDSLLRNFVAWSISVEIQFYTILAICLLFFQITRNKITDSTMLLIRLFMFLIYFLGFLDAKSWLRSPIIEYMPYFLFGATMWCFTQMKSKFFNIKFLDFVVIIPLLSRTISSRLGNAPDPSKTKYGAFISLFFIAMFLLGIFLKSSNLSKFSKFIGTSSYALYLLGGFTGIQIFIHFKNGMGITNSALLSYSICSIIALAYQKVLDLPLQRVILKKALRISDNVDS